MKFDEEAMNRILHEYEEMRTQNEENRRQRLEKVYQNIPRIKEIDDETQEVGSKVTRAIMQNPADAPRLRKGMRETFAKLRSERESLLRGAGLAADYTELKYHCPDCRDTGYTDFGRCRCMQQKMIDYAYAHSNIEELTKTQNFNTFSFEYYSNEIIPGEDISPLAQMKRIYGFAVEFIKGFDDPQQKSLLFYGQNGLGKTFLSSCIAGVLLDKGCLVTYTTATRLFSVYEDHKFGRRDNEDFIEQLYDCDLLIIDDLGAEYISKVTVPFLFDLLNTRLLNKKKFIISTNNNLSELAQLYTKRFVSRICESFYPLQFLGEDIRTIKSIKK